jgi:polar amino acid transport system substrate-binding protein
VVLGQFDSPGTPEHFGLLLEKGSPITTCISQAVSALDTAGTLKQLETQWLTASAGAPVLQ